MFTNEEIPANSSEVFYSLIEADDIDGISAFLKEIKAISVKRERSEVIEKVIDTLLKAAFERKKPEYIDFGIDGKVKNPGEIALLCVEEYLSSNDNQWLRRSDRLLDLIERKSQRSNYVASIGERFIEEGKRRDDPSLIRTGITYIRDIDFKKNRSEAIKKIIPGLTQYAAATQDRDLLILCSDIIQEIREMSTQSTLNLQIIDAFAAIGISNNDMGILDEAFHRATEIPQKGLGEEAFKTIFHRIAAMEGAEYLVDINGFIHNTFEEIPPESRVEYISAFTTVLIAKKRRNESLKADLEKLFGIAPEYYQEIITGILREIEDDPAGYILDTLLSEMKKDITPYGDGHLRRLIQVAVAKEEYPPRNDQLLQIYHIIADKPCIHTNTRIIFQLIEKLSSAGYIHEAYLLFARIIAGGEALIGKGMQTATILLKRSIQDGNLADAEQNLFPLFSGQQDLLDDLIVTSQEAYLSEDGIDSFKKGRETLLHLSSFHSSPDDAVIHILGSLIDSDIVIHQHTSSLLDLVQQIHHPMKQDQSIAQIIIEIAREGVNEANRDIIQHAVAIGCMIADEKTRSDAIVQIIYEIASLAIVQGDLNLLVRVNTWWKDLLTGEFQSVAIDTIIEGMIQFAREMSSTDALTKAHEMIQTVHDTKKRREQLESCISTYITIGCKRLEQPVIMRSVESLEWAIEPFLTALSILRNEISSPDRHRTITNGIDTIMDYSQKTDPVPYIIPISMLILEVDDAINRRAIILRCSTRIRPLLNQIDMNMSSPYETIATIIQSFSITAQSTTTLALIRQIVTAIEDPFIRSIKLCDSARAHLDIGELNTAGEILLQIRYGVDDLNPEEAHEILTRTAVLLTEMNSLSSRECIVEALHRIQKISPETKDHARRQLATAIVAYTEMFGEASDLPDPEKLLQDITDPIEFVYATIPVLKIISSLSKKRELIKKAYEKMNAIPIHYDRATLLIDFAFSSEIQMPWEDKEACIRSAIQSSESIKVPFIIATIKKRIITHLVNEYSTSQENHIGELIIELLESISDETVRMSIAEDLGLMVMLGSTDLKTDIPRILLEQHLNEGGRIADVALIERKIQKIHDRGVRAQYYLGIAMLIQRRSQSRRVEQLIQQAIREASIIRPLPRRAFILCDLALVSFVNGEYEHGGNLFDMAMATATNIITPEVRDEVISELYVAMQLIQEMDDEGISNPGYRIE
ncbi:hypothetical protein J2T58_000912 [Methanocalculus alkaliphilus]|uniref:hypothetical protein n=1 Tax=Methanocalculus alkaliphilus TaxID=768730 RepID=UPI00209EF1EA|nr:hypothetical protein [Methanocalculus alkaliphilus]MCP1715064.1 hypothetical protein [Methanocalculus alkaliphilus]